LQQPQQRPSQQQQQQQQQQDDDELKPLKSAQDHRGAFYDPAQVNFLLNLLRAI